MCTLTILQYPRCNCNARDGNDGNGFIVTKKWHSRLLLDRDAVPFRCCLQARCFALTISQSNTVEFSRCRNVQVKTVCFEEEVCFRCLMDRRSRERADRIRALLAEHKSFSSRCAATRHSATKEAKFTKDMWQSIRASHYVETTWKDKKQKFVGTIGNLCSTQLDAVKEGTPDWEARLENQISSRAKRADEVAKTIAGEISSEEKEQEAKRRQNRLTCIQLCLAQANKRSISPTSGEEAHGSPPPEYEETEQKSSFQEVAVQRLRIARPARRSLHRFGPTLDVMVSARTVQSFRDKHSAQALPAPLETIPPEIVITHPSVLLSRKTRVVKSDTIGPSTAIDIDVLIPDVSEVESARNPRFPTLSAEVPNFKPFRKPPPTEPQLMRAPNAPRAMREDIHGSLPRTMCRTYPEFASVQGYATTRYWRM